MSAWIVETLVATTVLMVLVLLVRGHVARLLGARTAYLLWLLPALRMVLPPLPESVGPAPIAQLPVVVDFSMIEAVELAPVTPESGIAWGTVVLAIWLTGALCYFGWHLIAYRRFVRNALARATQLPEFDRGGIEVCASQSVDGPFATGVFVPRIVLPYDYRYRYSAQELRLALTHEWAHHRRGDLSFNYFALAMLSLHWFNPVAHRAWRAFRADQELACDAIVLAHATPDERHAYGSALVKSACVRTPVAACALNPRNQLKTRLLMMRDARERMLVGRALAVAIVGGGLALTASGGIAAEKTREVESSVRGAVVEKTAMLQASVVPEAPLASEAPQPPVAPPAPAAPVAAGATVPPVPPVPTTPPASRVEWHSQAWKGDVEEARREAMREAAIAQHEAAMAQREAMLEAGLARREAMREAAMAQREALRATHDTRKAMAEAVRVERRVVVLKASEAECKGKDAANETVESRTSTGNGKKEHVIVTRICMPAIDAVKIREHQISALSSARAGLSAASELSSEQRKQALASIDAQLARLKQQVEK